jgi:prepilin-type N-terminal cleavage/methylation domain-containing protein
MTRRQGRPGVTLIEVLVTIFIMAIGMLALLVLFPLGALKMGQALRDDRCASSAALADSIALTWDIRHDATNVIPAFTANGVNTALLGPSNGVLVDPYFAPVSQTVGTSTLPRRTFAINGVNVAGNQAVRWCTLLDDDTFAVDGTPDLGSNNNATNGPPGYAQRAEAFTWAWLVRQSQAGSSAVVDMSIVVYRKRDVSILVESTFNTVANGTLPNSNLAGSNTMTISYGAPGGQPNLRTGQWVLDTSPSASGNGAVPGYFYRVVGYTDYGNGTMELELETNLKQNVTQVVVPDAVAEVFDRGTGWRP